MRGLVTTVAVAVALAAAIVGVGFGIQAAVLGKPDRGQIPVVHAIARLIPYTTSHGQITINGTRLTTSCRTRWLEQRLQNDRARRPRMRRSKRYGRHLQDDTKQRFARFELAGCPRVLRKWLATQINAGTRIGTIAACSTGCRRSAALPRAALGLTVYVLAQFGASGGVAADGPCRRRVHAAPLHRADRNRAHAIRRAAPRPA